MDIDDFEILNSLEIVYKCGIKIVWIIQKDSNVFYLNIIKIIVKNVYKIISVIGIFIGGGNIQVIEFNGFVVFFNMNILIIIIVY